MPPTSYVSTGTIPDYSSYMPQPDITTSYSQYVPAQVAVPRFGISDYLVKNRWVTQRLDLKIRSTYTDNTIIQDKAKVIAGLIIVKLITHSIVPNVNDLCMSW